MINAELTNREVAILRLVCQHYTSEEIVYQLFIIVNTVIGNRNNVLIKTSSSNVTRLVLFAFRNNVISVV